MADAHSPDMIVRYTPAERLGHWVVVIFFVLAAASGLALFHPALFWMSGLLGGGPWSVVLHPFAGLAMCVAFYVFVRPLWHHNRMEPRDRAWLSAIRYVLAGCLIALFVSGIVIWRSYFSGYFGISIIRASALLHAFAAFILVAGILVHVSAALWVKGSVPAMMSGTVTLGWAFKHHRAWFREMIRPSSGR